MNFTILIIGAAILISLIAMITLDVIDEHNDLQRSEKLESQIEKLQMSFEVFNQRLSEIKFCEACTCGPCADVGNLKFKSFVLFREFLIKKIELLITPFQA